MRCACLLVLATSGIAWTSGVPPSLYAADLPLQSGEPVLEQRSYARAALDSAHDVLERLESVRRALASDDNVDHLDDKLFDEEPWRIAVTSLLCWMITTCAVAAGIGGGGLLVPLYALVLDLGTKRAIPVSKATIFGVACGNVFFITRRKHPNANRPLIDYQTVCVMQPGELMGVIIGVLMNRFLPEVIIVILLVVVLGFNAYKTLKKGIARWRSETKIKLAEAKGTRSNNIELQEVDHQSADDDSAEPGKANASDVVPAVKEAAAEAEAAISSELQAILDEEAIQYPIPPYVALACMASFLVLYSLLMNQVIVKDLDNCSPAYWPLYWSPVLVYGLIVFYYGRRNINRWERKEALGWKPIEGDMAWTKANVLTLTPAAVGAGVAAGLLGIGGGMILGPLFVSLNFQPQVGTASTGFMILFTALAGTVQYLAVGKLGWQFALWFGCIGAIGGQTGQRFFKRLIDRTGRPSIIVLMLGSIIALAVAIMASSGIVNVVGDANDGEDVWAVNTDLFVCNE